MQLIITAKNYASTRHAACNHLYDGRPYSFHLNMVAEAATRFSQSYANEIQARIVAAAWCHDLIEDARETYNDVKNVVGPEVADIVYALTNEKGRTRAERANERYYQGIRETPYATLVKVCDRIANVQYSLEQNSKMLEMYAREYENFRQKLYQAGEYDPAWQQLEALLF